MMSCSVKEVDFLNYNCRTRVSATFFYTGDLSLQQLPLIPLYVTKQVVLVLVHIEMLTIVHDSAKVFTS